MTLHKNAYFCAKLQKKVDFDDISDLIVGAVLVGATVWGTIVTPILEHFKKRERAERISRKERYAPGQPPKSSAKASPSPRKSAPKPRPVAARHIAEAEDFKEWKGAASAAYVNPGPETKVSPFISGEEGLRVTSDVDINAELEPIADSRPAAADILGSSAEDLRRGVIWAEILKPKYQE